MHYYTFVNMDKGASFEATAGQFYALVVDPKFTANIMLADEGVEPQDIRILEVAFNILHRRNGKDDQVLDKNNTIDRVGVKLAPLVKYLKKEEI